MKNQCRSCCCIRLWLCLWSMCWGVGNLVFKWTIWLAQNTGKRQCKKEIASWQLSPTVTSSCSTVNSTEALIAALLQRDRSETSQLLHNPSPWRALHMLPRAEGKQLAVSSACKALATIAQALKELKLLWGKRVRSTFYSESLEVRKGWCNFLHCCHILAESRAILFHGSWWCPQRVIQLQHICLLHSK